jgi:lipopolysaccharide transport system permease protein
MSNKVKEERFDWSITSQTHWWGGDWKELWEYHNLLFGLVRREFLLYYKQTFLGPVWMLLQPVMTLVIYLLVFGKLVGIPTGTVPPVLFYLSGIVLWNFFSEGFLSTSRIFQDNIQLFTKVYFPRIILPLSGLLVQGLRFLIQFIFLIILIAYYNIFNDLKIALNIGTLFLPCIILMIGLIGLAFGICCSMLTAKYRDLNNLVPTGVRLLMFLTPIIYPVSGTPENLRWLVLWNPLTPLFESFKFALLGEGTFTMMQLGYSVVCALVFLIIGLTTFNKHGDRLIDVV